MLPDIAEARKQYPVGTGVIDYFPDALAEVAYVSKVGNDQHNPGQPLHWNRAKSTDEPDCLIRHFIQRGTRDTDGTRHSAKLAWRALALLQKEIENEIQMDKAPSGVGQTSQGTGTQLENVGEATRSSTQYLYQDINGKLCIGSEPVQTFKNR